MQKPDDISQPGKIHVCDETDNVSLCVGSCTLPGSFRCGLMQSCMNTNTSTCAVGDVALYVDKSLTVHVCSLCTDKVRVHQK